MTVLADFLPLSVPKLNASGLNWAILSLYFQDAIKAKGYWGHFDGTEPCPAPATAGASPTDKELAVIAQ